MQDVLERPIPLLRCVALCGALHVGAANVGFPSSYRPTEGVAGPGSYVRVPLMPDFAYPTFSSLFSTLPHTLNKPNLFIID